MLLYDQATPFVVFTKMCFDSFHMVVMVLGLKALVAFMRQLIMSSLKTETLALTPYLFLFQLKLFLSYMVHSNKTNNH